MDRTAPSGRAGSTLCVPNVNRYRLAGQEDPAVIGTLAIFTREAGNDDFLVGPLRDIQRYLVWIAALIAGLPSIAGGIVASGVSNKNLDIKRIAVVRLLLSEALTLNDNVLILLRLDRGYFFNFRSGIWGRQRERS